MNLLYQKRKQILVITLFIFFGLLYRVIDHIPNFSPIAAIALFSGFYFKNKYILFLPLAILILSDLYLGAYQWQIMVSVYISFIIIVFLGIFIKKLNFKNVIMASLASSVLFFIITNFAVWNFSAWYPHNLNGLLQCYYMAIPFFRNTLFGDLFYVGLFFGAYELCVKYFDNFNVINKKNYVREKI